MYINDSQRYKCKECGFIGGDETVHRKWVILRRCRNCTHEVVIQDNTPKATHLEQWSQKEDGIIEF